MVTRKFYVGIIIRHLSNLSKLKHTYFKLALYYKLMQKCNQIGKTK